MEWLFKCYSVIPLVNKRKEKAKSLKGKIVTSLLNPGRYLSCSLSPTAAVFYSSIHTYPFPFEKAFSEHVMRH
jgi:hypothetical protein